MNILICIPTTQSLPESIWVGEEGLVVQAGKGPPCLLSITSHRSQISWPWETRHSFTFLCPAKTMGPLVNGKKPYEKNQRGAQPHNECYSHTFKSAHVDGCLHHAWYCAKHLATQWPRHNPATEEGTSEQGRQMLAEQTLRR